MKIKFINPFGTSSYDTLIFDTMKHYAKPDTELVVEHIETGPKNIDYYWPKHLMETEIYEAVIKTEKEGFDAVIIGCAYDPGVRVSRELVDIPVIGPLEATLQMASYYGHTTTVITDHRKAAPYIQDQIRLYGYNSSFCKKVDVIDWYVEDMIKSPLDTAKDAFELGKKYLKKHNAESVIVACTIISASLEYAILQGEKEYLEIPMLNPNTMALKMAESMAHLYQLNRYQINRTGYYSRLEDHNKDEFQSLINKHVEL